MVRLRPRGPTDRVDGVRDGELRVRVAAPPVDGAANSALLRLLARELDVAPTSIRLVAGAAGRRKIVSIGGISSERIVARWPGLRL